MEESYNSQFYEDNTLDERQKLTASELIFDLREVLDHGKEVYNKIKVLKQKISADDGEDNIGTEKLTEMASELQTLNEQIIAIQDDIREKRETLGRLIPGAEDVNPFYLPLWEKNGFGDPKLFDGKIDWDVMRHYAGGESFESRMFHRRDDQLKYTVFVENEQGNRHVKLIEWIVNSKEGIDRFITVNEKKLLAEKVMPGDEKMV
jgi:hypothetical protein